MHKKVRSVPSRKLRNSAISHWSAVPQEIETVSIFHANIVVVNQSQRRCSNIGCNSRLLQHTLAMARKGRMTKFKIDADIGGLLI